MTRAVPVFSPWARRAVSWCCFCLLILSCTTVQATLTGSLGLKWGLPLSDFRTMGFDIEAEWPIWHQAMAVRVVDRTPRLAETGSLILVFDNELGLVKSHWASKPIERDETGRKGLETFKKLKAKIFQQYGAPQEVNEKPSLKLEGFHGNFYQCLQDTTCGQWESVWETPEGELLLLKIVGLDPGVGFIQLTQQGPNLNKTLRLAHPGLDSMEHEI